MAVTSWVVDTCGLLAQPAPSRAQASSNDLNDSELMALTNALPVCIPSRRTREAAAADVCYTTNHNLV